MSVNATAAPPDTLAWSRTRVIAWIVGITIALMQAFIYRDWVFGDTISYLDMSDAVSSGDWSRMNNATWSPLYPLLLGVAAVVVRPSAAWEFPLAHYVNVLCFVFALVCFEFLLREMLASASPDEPQRPTPFTKWYGQAIAYALFLWASLGMLTLMKATPDMLMTALLYLALGLLLRIKNGRRTTRTYAALGVVLGLGYLSKAIMFPLGIIMLVLTVFVGGRAGARTAIGRTTVTALAFMLVALPNIVVVSRLAHRVSFSEAATVVHFLYFDDIRPYWQGVGNGTGRFVHPPRKILDTVPTFEFRRPMAVTTGMWFDPAYWTEGGHPGFNPRRQAKLLLQNLLLYADVAARTGALLAALVVLWCAVGAHHTLRAVWAFWPLWLVAAMALGAYATLHVEERYIGGLFALVWIALLFGFRIPTDMPRGVMRGLVAIIVINLTVLTAGQMVRDYRANDWKKMLSDVSASDALGKLGISRGDRVACINPCVAHGWARLAKVSITAEVQGDRSNEFWQGSPDLQHTVLDALAKTGVKAIVGFNRGRTLPPGWRRLGVSPYVAFLVT